MSPPPLMEKMAMLKEGQKMQNLITFNFKEKTIRTLEKDGQLWFVIADVAKALEYKHTPHATRLLEDYEKDVQFLDTLGGRQKMTITNESGLYTMIMNSNKLEAKAFKKWVTSEVLPSIRKTGAYTVDTFIPEPAMEIPAPDFTQNKQMMNELEKMITRCCVSALREQIADYNLKNAVKQTDLFNSAPTADGMPMANWLMSISHSLSAINSIYEQMRKNQKEAVKLLA